MPVGLDYEITTQEVAEKDFQSPESREKESEICILVVNKFKEKYTVYIGRPSVFGNPFTIGKDGTRSEVIAKFEDYARSNLNLLNKIKCLPEDAILGCFCKPLPCHGDIIIKLWKELTHKEE